MNSTQNLSAVSSQASSKDVVAQVLKPASKVENRWEIHHQNTKELELLAIDQHILEMIYSAPKENGYAKITYQEIEKGSLEPMAFRTRLSNLNQSKKIEVTDKGMRVVNHGWAWFRQNTPKSEWYIVKVTEKNGKEFKTFNVDQTVPEGVNEEFNQKTKQWEQNGALLQWAVDIFTMNRLDWPVRFYSAYARKFGEYCTLAE